MEEAPVSEEQMKLRELRKQKRKRNAENRKKKWFNQKVNTYIYIQGLSGDTTVEELSDYFKKCGMIKLDPNTGESSIKLYKEGDKLKGDARIGFIQPESVDTAIQMLDNSHFRADETTIKVSQAQF